MMEHCSNKTSRTPNFGDENSGTTAANIVTTKSSDLTTIKIVTQRVTRGKLLVNETEDEWASASASSPFKLPPHELSR